MGKYAATRAFQRDRDRNKNGKMSFSGTVDYLLDVPNNEAQFRVQSFLYGADPTGLYHGYIDQRDAANYWNDYFKHTGLSWSDIKYPSKMFGFGSSGSNARTTANFVSKNISRLYR